VNLALGIDTGGTYTDAVLLNHDTGQVLAGTKALTTRHNLAIGIGAAMAQVFSAAQNAGLSLRPQDVVLVSLSTTLATNTLAEGQGAAVSLILIGYDAQLMQQYGFHGQLSTQDVVYVRGGHDQFGNEVAPLDEERAFTEISARRGKVEAFAVSGFFAVRNPAHENRVRQIVQELTGCPVTCGHELSSQLNAVRRATTAALNAHLILPLRELIASVQHTLADVGIAAPLMVVKGDGSLMRAELAMQRPVETILSGPAASVVGAWHLAGRRDVWVVDVGGTTTDIGALQDGLPNLNNSGARVAGWRTMVEAIDVHTAGLGGDSHVKLADAGGLAVGPRRVVPLCLLADQYPEVLKELRQQAAESPKKLSEEHGEFLLLGRKPARQVSDQEAELLLRLGEAPCSVASLMRQARLRGVFRREVEAMEAKGLIRRAAFTPTDALHALGRFVRWDAEAARLGATVLAKRAGLPVEALCEQTVEVVTDRIATEIVSKVIEDEVGAPAWDREPVATALVRRAFSRKDGASLACELSLRQPLVAIGAPVGAYMPGVAERLHTELIIPSHAEVANAVGAVAGGVVQRVRILISPLPEGDQLRLHLPTEMHDFGGLEDAAAYALDRMLPYMEMMARQAGAEEIETHVDREDHWVPLRDSDRATLYMGSELTFSAVGRPSPARR
jgi:N-methylhydantoinase A/oxoprolinase/acetone carboxylase beta subunit